tara:strand:+ start:1706 stop:1810 length:105 start_codon:yes stop_codon:yes gene_type:complete
MITEITVISFLAGLALGFYFCILVNNFIDKNLNK